MSLVPRLLRYNIDREFIKELLLTKKTKIV